MDLDARLSQNSSRMWTQEAWRFKHQVAPLKISFFPLPFSFPEFSFLQYKTPSELLLLTSQDTNVLSVSTTPENKDADEESTIQGMLGFGSSVGPPMQGSPMTSEEGREDMILTQSDRLGIKKTTRNEGQTFQNKSRFGLTPSGCLFLVWVLCLLCLVLSAVLGIRYFLPVVS